MAKAMRVRAGDAGSFAMMAEDRTQTGGSHGTAAARTFEDDEERIGSDGLRSLVTQVTTKAGPGLWSQRKDPIFVSLPVDPDLILVELDVLESEADDLTRAQSAEQHQRGDGEISPGSERSEERGEFFTVERNDESARHLDPEMGAAAVKVLGVTETDGPVERGSGLLTHAASSWQRVSGVELVEPPQDEQPQVDRAWSGASLVFVDEADELEEMSLGQLVESQSMLAHPMPSAPECKRVGSNSGACEASQRAGIEKGVDRLDLRAIAVNQPVGGRVCSLGVKDDQEARLLIVHIISLKISRIGCNVLFEERGARESLVPPGGVGG